MLSRLWRRRRRYSNEEEQMWVRHFTADVNVENLSVIPGAEAALAASSAKSIVNPDDLNESLEVPNGQFLPEIFKCNVPITESDVQFILLMSRNLQEKALDAAAPAIFRLAIRFSYRFGSDLQELLQNGNQEIESRLKFWAVLSKVLSAMPPKYAKDVYALKYTVLKTLATDDDSAIDRLAQPASSLFDELAAQAALNACERTLTIIDLPEIEYLIQHFWCCAHSPKHSDPEREDLRAKTLIRIIDVLRAANGQILSKIPLAFVDKFVKISIARLERCLVDDLDNEMLYDYGQKVLSLLKKIAALNVDFMRLVLNQQTMSSIALFVAWIIDRFPIIDFETIDDGCAQERELFCADSDAASQGQMRRMEFHRVKTFEEPVPAPAFLAKLEDKKPFETDYSNNPLNEKVGQNEKLSKVVGLIAALSKFSESLDFVKTVICAMLDFSASIAERKSEYVTDLMTSPERVASSMVLVMVKVLDNMAAPVKFRALQKVNGFQRLLSTCVFSPKYVLWECAQENGDLKFFAGVRAVVFGFIGRCFFTSIEVAVLCMEAFEFFLVVATPQMGAEAVTFVMALFRANPAAFRDAFKKTRILDCLVDFTFTLQKKHFEMIEAGIDQKFVQFMGQSRIELFHLWDLVTQYKPIMSFCLMNACFVRLFFTLFCEPDVQAYAMGIVIRCLLLKSDGEGQFELVFGEMDKLFQESHEHKNDQDWIDLIVNFVGLLPKPFACNRQLLSYVRRWKWMIAASELVLNADEFSQSERLIDAVLRTFRPITTGNLGFRKDVSQTPMKIICSRLENENLQARTIDLLLELVFESEFSLTKPPRMAEIANQKILSYIHMATKHLPEHHQIFAYITRICMPSVLNKLKVFKSNMLIHCLRYIRSFESDLDCSEQQRASVNTLLNLFSIVSSFVFHWKTFFEAISMMYPTKSGYRPWWTSQLISTFTNILSSISETHTPSSFFHFDGRGTELVLPENIPGSVIDGGFTFLSKFELGSVIGKRDGLSCLFWLEISGGPTVAVLLSPERKLIIHYYKCERHPNPIVMNSDFAFGANQWYTLSVSFDSRYCNANVNGEQVFSAQLAGDFRHSRSTARGFVANSASKDMPLKFNMSCCYLFSGALSADILRLIATLPVDFVYSFVPSSWSLFPEIEGREYSALFSGSLASREVFCYNARMTIDSVIAANVARNGIGNARVRAEVIPFSTTFCDVSYNIGGLKTFLPLFQQVDYLVEREEHNDAGSFMLTLSGLFAQFCRCSEDIQRDFITCGGMKCLAYLFTKVKSDSFQSAVIIQMDDLYSRLEQETLKMAMMEDFWLNFTMWRAHSASHQITMITKFLSKELQLGSTLMRLVSVAFFLMIVLDEPRDDVRAKLWELIVGMGKIRLTPLDKELMFAASLCHQSTEVLGHVLFFLENKINNFHKVVEPHGVYPPFLTLLSVREEDIAVMGFRYLVQLGEHEACGAIQSPIPFDQAMLSAISVFSPENKTVSFWTACSSALSGNPALQAALFPFACFLSHFYDQELILKSFVPRLNSMLVPFQSMECESMIQCHVWYFWLFYMYLQTSRPQLDFRADAKPVTTIYAKVLTTLLWKEDFTGFRRAIGFLIGIIVMRKWDLTFFIRGVLREMLTFAKHLDSETAACFCLWEFIRFMFFIPNVEVYAKNVELYGKHEVTLDHELCSECQGNPELSVLSDMYLNFSIEDLLYCSFSGRFDADGKWQDADLAIELMEYVCNAPIKPGAFLSNRLRVMDLIAFVLGSIVRHDPSKADRVCELFKKLPIQSLNISFMIFFTQLYHATRNDTRVYDSFCRECASIVGQFAQPGQPLLVSHQQFIDFAKDSIPAFYASMNDLCVSTLNDIKNDILGATNDIVNRLKLIRKLKTDPSVLTLWERERIKHNLRIQRQKAFCEKAFKRIFRELSTNGGPWSPSKKEQHWRLWQICDQSYRRVFLKPNPQFDLHKDASFRRDESSLQEARQKYERWLQDTQVETAEDEEELMYKEETEVREGDYEFSTEAQLVTIRKTYTGTFFMNNNEIWFNDPDNKSIQFYTSELEMVLHRSYLHIDKGLEFFLTSKRSFFLYFPKGDRQKILQTLKYLSLPNLTLLQTGPSKDFIWPFTDKWRQGLLSNYEYLMCVNFLGGRSFNDLSQYPVFPWILCDYTSEHIDLNDPSVYRDLSKPIGTMNEKRLEGIVMNYEMCPDDIPEKCFYRMHYSNAFYVLHWLVRLEPYTTLHIEVNDTKFDKPNRMFWSIPKSWEAVTSLNPDFRELIPEFFTLPEFLMNRNHFDLGFNPDAQTKLDDVVLPPWAENAHMFIEIHRAALESPHVSRHLNEWIDLMFGFKQQGPEAIRAQNTFHLYCYQSCITKEILRDPEMLMTIQTQASNVGIVPRQLFSSSHPKKTIFDLIPSFSSAKVDILFKLKLTPRYIFLQDYVLYSLGGDCVLRSIELPKALKGTVRGQAVPLGSIEKFLILPPATTSLSKSFAFVPELSKLVTSSLFDNTFHVFRMTGSEIVHMESFRQKFSLLSTLNYAGGGYILASWRDSSLTLWDLRSRSPRPLYRVTPHLTSLVDVEVDAKLGLIASLDKDRNCIISLLRTGKLVRRFVVDGTDPLQKLALFSNGIIAVLSSAELPRKESTITIYGIDATKIHEFEFKEPVREWRKAEFDSGICGIALAFESGRFVFLTLPECKCAIDIVTGQEIKFIEFIPQIHTLILVSEARDVFTITLS